MDQPVSAAAMLPKFRNATERLRSGRLLDLPDALSVQQQLEAVAVAAAESATAAVAGRLLGHGSFPAALLDLLTAALDARNCSDACGLALEAHSELCLLASEAVSALMCFPPGDCPSPEALDFATRLLRTQTLQRCSRLLAAATEDVQIAGAPATQRAADIIGAAGRLVGALADAARCSIAEAASADMPGAAAGSSRVRQQQREQRRASAFATELAAAVRDSGVAEHLARATLHLYLHLEQPAEAPGGDPGSRNMQPAMVPAIAACCGLLDLHTACYDAAKADGPAASSLREVLGGRCVRHLALSSALAELCVADGGPPYGLPEELLLGLPVLDNDSRQPVDLRQRHGVQQLSGVPFILSTFVLELGFQAEPTPPPPPGRRAAVALLLRLGRLAVESGRAWAGADAGAARVVAEGDSGEAGNSAGRPLPEGLCAAGGGGSGGDSVPSVPKGIGSDDSVSTNSGVSSNTNDGGSGGRGASGGGHASNSGGNEGGRDDSGAGSGSSGGGGSGRCSGDTVLAAGPSNPLPVLLHQPLRLLLSREDFLDIGTQALENVCYIFEGYKLHEGQQGLAATAAGAAVEGAGAARAGWQDEAVAEWWRLAVAAALHLPIWASADQVARLAERVFLRGLAMGQLPLDAPLPRALPPPWAAAALAAGVLPCFERLLRRAGEAPEAAEAALVLSLAEDCFDLDMLAPLLAYGEPRQAAALVATVRKLLMCRAGPDLLLATCAKGTAHGPCDKAIDFAACVLGVVLEWMLSGAGYAAIWQQPGELSAGQAAAVGAGAREQLAQVVSYAASEWLPHLSRLFEAMAPLQTGGGTTLRLISMCMKPLLAWVPLLARCGALEPGAVAVPAAAGGWRRWLLEEVRVVPLLGSALGLLPLLLLQQQQRAQQGASVAGFLLGRLLGKGCCCVAAAFPDEVRGAALSAATAEGGVATGAAGASRSGGVGGRSNVGRAGDRSRARTGASRSSNPSGQDRPADWARAAAASGPGGWRPSLLRALAAELSAHGGCAAEETVAAAVADLAGWLEVSCAGGSGGGGVEAGAGLPSLLTTMPAWGEGASGLRVPPPVEARALLGTCANPACGNLAGGSEAELPLRACGRCGAAWYCRAECQTAHWRAGHREACGRNGVSGRAAGGPGA